MAKQFRDDLKVAVDKMAWIEWRLELLTGDPTFLTMIVIAKANLQSLHDGFHASEHTMIQEAKDFGNQVLKGVFDSLFPDRQSAFQALGCSNPKPVGDLFESMIFFGLEQNDGHAGARWVGKELFWLSRDMWLVFKLCQKYQFHTADTGYHISDLRNVVRKMQLMERGLAAHR